MFGMWKQEFVRQSLWCTRSNQNEMVAVVGIMGFAPQFFRGILQHQTHVQPYWAVWEHKTCHTLELCYQ